MHSVKEFEIIDNTIINNIITVVNDDKTEFNKSLLYSTKTQTKFIDETLFDYFDQLIDKINELDCQYNYSVVHNDITYIKYSKDGFFKKHSDFLSFTSNLIEEYTLILCVDANCKGGETILHINQFFKYASNASITPKKCLLFRKDIVHEENLIEDGYKHVLTVNLMRTPKGCDKIIIISFLNETKKRILKYNDVVSLGNSMLNQFIELHDLSNKRVIDFEDMLHTYDQFDIIENIYCKKFIGYDEINDEDNKNIIDYYVIDYDNILFNEKTIIYKIKQQKQYILDKNSLLPDIVLCDNMKECSKYTNDVKQNSLSYVPFMVVLGEGSGRYDLFIENEPYSLNMINVFSCFGENKAIYNYVNKRCFVDNIIYSNEEYEGYEQSMEEYEGYEQSMEEYEESAEFHKFKNKITSKFTIKDIWKRKEDLKDDFITNEDIKIADKIIVTQNDYDKINRRIKELNLFEYIKNNLKSIYFNFTPFQVFDQENYCEGTISYNFTHIGVYGLMKIE
jgi:hypothetical protein